MYEHSCKNLYIFLFQDHKIIILGAGMAGVSAARRLKDLGYTNYQLLEASNRVGGRMATDKLGQYTVELGPAIIHAAVNNPILELINTYNVSHTALDYTDAIVRDINASVITGEAVNVYGRITPAFEKLKSDVNIVISENRPDFTLRSALNKAGWKPTSTLDEVIEFLEIDTLYGYGPEEISGKYAFLSEEKENAATSGDHVVMDDRGYGVIVKNLIEEVIEDGSEKLKLNRTVTGIEEKNGQITITTDIGESFTADYVIVTFSLGVLQNKKVTFSPELPEWKMDAITQFQMAHYTHIYIQFNSTFWDDEAWILYTGDSDGFNIIFNVNKLHPSSHILHFQVANKNAVRLERLSDADVVQEIMMKLQQIYGKDSSFTVPSPVNFRMSRFSTNPLFYGAWSNWPPGYTKDSHDALRAPVGRIYFAGEHTSYRYYGYLHGAYHSGNEVIDALDLCISRSVCQKYVPMYAARGCRYTAAVNYDHTAKEDDGSCQFPCTSSSSHISLILSNLIGCFIFIITVKSLPTG